jgi:hypothetical protein
VQRQSLCPPEAILPDFQAITVKRLLFLVRLRVSGSLC